MARFEHEALFYATENELLGGTVAFLREGLDHGEPALVALPAERIGPRREALDGAADRVEFVDMTRLGRNPARIISAWREFLVRHDAPRRSVRGVGEPVWPGRPADEVVECQHHESLLNLAFAEGPAWRLLCPYDAAALERDVLDEARRSHPVVSERGARCASASYAAPVPALESDADLPEPLGPVQRMAFTGADLGEVRRLVARRAAEAGFDVGRASDLMLAVSEVASNSVRHAGGRGTLSVWSEPGALVCEVRDGGRIEDPLVGRARPSPGQRGGYGLWLVNELCDLVQVRSSPAGSVVRLQLRSG